MASFDIKSLFTNVPLGETIDIVADTLYDVLDKPVLSLNKNFLKLCWIFQLEMYYFSLIMFCIVKLMVLGRDILLDLP